MVLKCDQPGATIADITYASYGTAFCHRSAGAGQCTYTTSGDIFPGTCDNLPTNVSCSLATAAATVRKA